MENTLPIYKLKINPDTDGTGVDFVAFVDEPAVNQRVNWVAFNKSQKFLANEEKQIVTGVMMVADMPIYRRDADMGEYYVVFDAPTIEQIVLKFFKEKNISNVNKNHEPNKKVSGAYLFESYIVNKEKGKPTPQGFDELPDGSWVASYKVDDVNTWNEIKEGKFNGFSVEGNFIHELVKMSKHKNMEISEKLKAIKNIVFGEEAPTVEKKEEQKFMDAKLADGTLVRIDGEMVAGSTISVIAEDGSLTPLASGEYEIEGMKVTVDNGVIAAAEEMKAEEPKEKETAKEEVDMSQFAKVEDMAAFKAEILNAIAEMQKSVDAKFESNNSVQKDIVEVIEKMSATPAATPTEKKKVFDAPVMNIAEALKKLKK